MSTCFCVSVWLLMGPEVLSEKDASNFRRHTLILSEVAGPGDTGLTVCCAMWVGGQEDM